MVLLPEAQAEPEPGTQSLGIYFEPEPGGNAAFQRCWSRLMIEQVEDVVQLVEITNNVQTAPAPHQPKVHLVEPRGWQLRQDGLDQ